MSIFVSTSAIVQPFDLAKVLQTFNENGIKNIELGSSHRYMSNIEEILNQYSNINFVVHNYFPPPKKEFALNIASFDEEIRNNSIKHAKTAIDLCAKVGAPLYSMHAGMLADPNSIVFFEGFQFEEKNITLAQEEKAFRFLVQSCKEINEYAKQRGIKFAIETSGGHPSKFHLLLMTKIAEFEKLYTEIDDENFGILLDIGHYNISIHLYGNESYDEFIRKFKDKIFQVHIHHNDGSDDQHKPPTAKELAILKNLNDDVIIVLESMNCSIESIQQSLAELNEFEKRKGNG